VEAIGRVAVRATVAFFTAICDPVHAMAAMAEVGSPLPTTPRFVIVHCLPLRRDCIVPPVGHGHSFLEQDGAALLVKFKLGLVHVVQPVFEGELQAEYVLQAALQSPTSLR
jgi:hypothetical protein